MTVDERFLIVRGRNTHQLEHVCDLTSRALLEAREELVVYLLSGSKSKSLYIVSFDPQLAASSRSSVVSTSWFASRPVSRHKNRTSFPSFLARLLHDERDERDEHPRVAFLSKSCVFVIDSQRWFNGLRLAIKTAPSRLFLTFAK